MRSLNLETKTKKAQSQVITTILIILLVLAVIIIVYNVIKNVVETSSSGVGTEQFAVSLSASKIGEFSDDTIQISVTRSPGKGNITALRFIFKDVAGVEVCRYENETDLPSELETKVYIIDLTSLNCVGFYSFDVYPIIKTSSGKEVIGLKASVKEKGTITQGGTQQPCTLTCDTGEKCVSIGGVDRCVIELSACNNNLNQAGKYYLLTQSLTEISTTCFIIKNNSITLDMNGFSITGSGSGNTGITSTGYNSTTIKNGAIYGFLYGISLTSSSNNILTNITANNNTNGGLGGWGIDLTSSSNNILTNITANSNSGFMGGAGIILTQSSNNNILTGITSNSNSNYKGIYLSSSSNNTFTNITANSNAYGIYLSSSSNNNITNITANSNNYGIYLYESVNNSIFTNTISYNKVYGVYLYNSNTNIISNNYVCGNTDGVGTDYDFYCSSAGTNTFTSNNCTTTSGCAGLNCPIDSCGAS